MDVLLKKRLLLTPKEAAELLDIKVNTLATWRCHKRYPLPYIKCGRKIRYKEADINAFIEQRKISCEEAVW